MVAGEYSAVVALASSFRYGDGGMWSNWFREALIKYKDMITKRQSQRGKNNVGRARKTSSFAGLVEDKESLPQTTSSLV